MTNISGRKTSLKSYPRITLWMSPIRRPACTDAWLGDRPDYAYHSTFLGWSSHLKWLMLVRHELGVSWRWVGGELEVCWRWVIRKFNVRKVKWSRLSRGQHSTCWLIINMKSIIFNQSLHPWSQRRRAFSKLRITWVNLRILSMLKYSIVVSVSIILCSCLSMLTISFLISVNSFSISCKLLSSYKIHTYMYSVKCAQGRTLILLTLWHKATAKTIVI